MQTTYILLLQIKHFLAEKTCKYMLKRANHFFNNQHKLMKNERILTTYYNAVLAENILSARLRKLFKSNWSTPELA